MNWGETAAAQNIRLQNDEISNILIGDQVRGAVAEQLDDLPENAGSAALEALYNRLNNPGCIADTATCNGGTNNDQDDED